MSSMCKISGYGQTSHKTFPMQAGSKLVAKNIKKKSPRVSDQSAEHPLLVLHLRIHLPSFSSSDLLTPSWYIGVVKTKFQLGVRLKPVAAALPLFYQRLPSSLDHSYHLIIFLSCQIATAMA